MQAILLIVCLTGQFLLAVPALVSGCCPNGWTRFDNSCYLFVEKNTTWHNAKNKCNDLDGHLARITNDKEKNHLEQYLKTHHQRDPIDMYNYWIDGNDMAVDGDWLWEHSQRVTYFDWGPGEPNGGTAGNCMCLYGHWHFQMDDNACNNGFGFICELSNQIQGGQVVG